MNRLSTTVLVCGLFALAVSGEAAAAANERVASVTEQGGVAIVRGVGMKRPARPPEDAASAAPQVMTGDKAWLVDRKRNRLIACRLESTTQVGERRIRCGTRTLRALSGS